jgi:gamma-glutamyltranspeptidase / glutathione hydrolase
MSTDRTGVVAAGRSILAIGLALVAGVRSAAAGELPEALRTEEVRSTNGIVVANTREAAEAGARILRSGGNAIDAAVATAFALGVSEAEASGIGGQAWMLIHLADGQDVALDGSGHVPGAVAPEELLRLLDDSLLFGYKTVATPEALAVFDQALRRFGSKSVAEVLAPAIELADSGCRLPPHQRAILGEYNWKLRPNPTMRDIFLDASLEPWGVDHVYCMDDVAATMRALASRGLRDFYLGRIADAIDDDMRANGGYLRKSDLMTVRAIGRTPVKGRYRGLDVVSFPSPGGGAAVVEALQILDRFPPAALDPTTAAGIIVRIEAARIAFYDLLAAWESGPAAEVRMLDPGHAEHRAAQIDPERALPVRDIVGRDDMPTNRRRHGSTHVSVIDAKGNAVGLTLTYNLEFGACVATPGLGFPYNATLSLFDFDNPQSPGYPRPGNVLKQVAAPTILLRNGRPILAAGGPGSGRITSSIVNVIANVIDQGMAPAAAVSAPRAIWDGGRKTEVYIEMAPPHTTATLEELRRRRFVAMYALTFPPRPIDLLAFGGVNLAVADPATGTTIGAGDPRRAGAAAGGDSP